MALSSPMKLTSSASFSPSIRISLRLKIHQAQAKNFCRVLDIRVTQRMEVRRFDSGIGDYALKKRLVDFWVVVMTQWRGKNIALILIL